MSAALAIDLSAIQDRFISAHFDRHDALEAVADDMIGAEQPAPLVQEAVDTLHKIAGTSGSLGYPELGASAQRAEETLRQILSTNRIDTKIVLAVLELFLDQSQEFCIDHAA
ncbi:Hpt domain-containing protein [Alphaproteobacteria bacterium KMM 3653]|uniref:Hpt domain-containing protein n=1 Tax=Harenicola maris TaxID=2841044 RepID=A0AAP2CMP6_9RHOB|nr:Hpt domain-containing protein [Harenicola maris]